MLSLADEDSDLGWQGDIEEFHDADSQELDDDSLNNPDEMATMATIFAIVRSAYNMTGTDDDLRSKQDSVPEKGLGY
jgi:hypothetical protein